MQKTLAMIPEDLKQKLKRSKSKPQQPELAPEPAPVVPAAIPKGEPVVTEMMSILQQSQYQLPFTKAEKLLGYEPIVSFDEGCRRSIDWLSGIERFKPYLKK